LRRAAREQSRSVSEAPWNDDPEAPAVTERELLEEIGEGEPGGADYVTDDDAVDQADTADERL
jgi:hypothetical protein